MDYSNYLDFFERVIDQITNSPIAYANSPDIMLALYFGIHLVEDQSLVQRWPIIRGFSTLYRGGRAAFQQFG